jgi:uncharacterized protein with FMN-binding domain
VRRGTTVLTVLAAGAAMTTAWQVGSRPAPGLLSGVHVVAAPAGGTASRTSTGPAAKAGSKAGSKAGAKAAATPGATAAAPPAAPPVQRTVKGALVQTPYGDVQVQVVLVGTRIADVTPLHLTDSSGTSVDISAQAEPLLRQEALTAQSAKIDTISGATYTSQGYQASLQAALDAAHV